MSSYHYYIISKRRIKREKNSKHKENVYIEDVRYIKENNKVICEEDNIEKGKPDVTYNLLMSIAVLSFAVFICVLEFSDLIGIGRNVPQFLSDYVSSIGFFTMLYSIPWIRKFIVLPLFDCGKVGNKLKMSVIMFMLSLFVAMILFQLEISGVLSNLISIICIGVTLFNLH